MKVSRLIVGIIALSLAAAAAQAAPSSDNPSGPAGPACVCFTGPAGGGVCGIGTDCGTAPLCGGANPPCPAGSTCIDGASSCCGFTHCNLDCPAGVACSNPTACGGLAACQQGPVKPEDCTSAVPAPGPVTPCNDTTPAAAPWMSCPAGGTGLKDKWVSFMATAAAHRVRTDVASTGTDSSIEVYSGTCAALTEIACNGDISGTNYLSDVCVTGLTPGSTYYVRVGAYNDGQFGACGGNYAVTVETGSCGNGTIDCGEACDPPGPCCSATCQDIRVCGDNVRCGTEACDGTDDAACPGLCSATCTCNLPRCGDNIINQPTEICDGTATPLCPAGSYCATNCTCVLGIPAVSEWGLAVLTLIGLVSGTILFGRRRQAVN